MLCFQSSYTWLNNIHLYGSGQKNQTSALALCWLHFWLRVSQEMGPLSWTSVEMSLSIGISLYPNSCCPPPTWFIPLSMWRIMHHDFGLNRPWSSNLTLLFACLAFSSDKQEPGFKHSVHTSCSHLHCVSKPSMTTTRARNWACYALKCIQTQLNCFGQSFQDRDTSLWGGVRDCSLYGPCT